MKRQLYGIIALLLFLLMISIPVGVEHFINEALIMSEFDIYGEYKWVSPGIWISLYLLSFALFIRPIEKAIFLAT